jgi:hypothetical protein
MSQQQNNYKNRKNGMKDETHYNVWTQFLEDYKQYFKSDDKIWNENLDKVNVFILKYNKRPLQSSSNNSEEKKLGYWVSDQQTNYKNRTDGMKNEERYNAWTQFLKDYDEYFKSYDKIWNENLDKVNVFILKYNKRPLQSSKNAEEKRLGLWISTQHQNYKNKLRGMKIQERYNALTQFLKDYDEYFKSCDEIWNENIDKVITFINEYKNLPSKHSKNAEEKRLGLWISKQQQNYKNRTDGMKNKERYNTWTQFLEDNKQYFKDNNEIWNENLDKVNVFINEHKKLPSKHSKNAEEKRLGYWLSDQQTNYKNKKEGMKIQERYNVWTEFLKKNKEYFKNEQSIITELTTIESQKKDKPKKSMKLKTATKLETTKSENQESPEQRKQRTQSELSQLHQRYKTLKSENLSKEFQENPELWKKYHEISEENEKSFPQEDIPRNRIIQELLQIKTNRTNICVVDMGCGKGQISEYFKDDPRFCFINYDHISSHDTIISCDISNIPLVDYQVEICIMSLVMWGSNCRDYIGEAHRILESGGKLYIIEATRRWSHLDESGNIIQETEAIKLINILKETGFQITKSSVEKFSLFVCLKI